jgi:branched-chain amino acid transport system ATP-binding protein
MNQEETEDLVRFILDVNEDLGTTVVLVEHDMSVVMEISSSVAVLDFGRLVTVGAPEVVANDPEVVRAYLGDANPASSTS